MMKKHRTLLIIFLIVVITAIGRYITGIPELKLVNYLGQDGIRDFYVKDGFVYIDGGLTVKNNTSRHLNFSFSAESHEDYENGLLMSPELTVYDKTLSKTRFSIAPKEEKTYHVFFVGKRGSGNQKYDRLIPDIIKITEIEKQ